MEKRSKRLIIGICTILIVVLMIIFVDFQKILENLSKISFLGIFLFCLTYTVSFIFRAYKLRLIFKGINLDPSYFTLYGSIGVGWAINEITPAKIGDLAKIEFIHEKDTSIPLSKSICAVALDRVIDLIILFSITCIALLFMYINNITGINDLNLQFFIGIGAVIIAGALIALVFLFFKTERVLNFVEKISVKLKNLLESFLKNFIDGMNDFRKNKRQLWLTMLFNIPTWFFDSLTLVVFFYLAGYEIDFLIIILAQLITFFTKAIPITPGGWGVSEIAGALIISLFYPAIPLNDLLSIFILDHFIRMAYIFVYGGTSAVTANFKFREIELERVEEEMKKLDD